MWRLLAQRVILGLLAVGLASVLLWQILPKPLGIYSWQPGDLRILQEPAGTLEIFPTAAYARRTARTIEIRLDLLSLPENQKFDLKLEIESGRTSGGSFSSEFSCPAKRTWDKTLYFSSERKPDSSISSAGLIPRLLQDPDLGVLVINIPYTALPITRCPLWFRAEIQAENHPSPAGTIGPFALDGPSPGRAQVLFAFDNTLPAATPAQTLRRWNGAHTGPYGQRHGLQVLLEAAQTYHIPLFLLDLRKPESLAGLDQVAGWDLSRDNPWITVPELGYGDPSAAPEAQALTRRLSFAYGLPSSPFYYGSNPPSDAIYVFSKEGLPDHLTFKSTQRQLPLPDPSLTASLAPSRAGLSSAFQKILIQTALRHDPSEILTLGGSLPDSGWGDQLAGQSGFAWLHSRPWVRILSPVDLESMPAVPANLVSQSDNPQPPSELPAPINSQRQPYPGFTNLRSFQNRVLSELRAASPGNLRDEAWQVYLHLTQPTPDRKLQSLLGNDFGVIGHLLAAEAWAQNPAPISRCDLDLDWDGLNECILANDQFFFVLEPDGGRLALGVELRAGTAQQINAVISQFGPGLSDSSTWQPLLGPAGDTGEIPGSFSDPASPYHFYKISQRSDQILFEDPPGGIKKVYSLSTRSLTIDVTSVQPYTTSILLTLAPELRMSPGWEKALLFSTHPGGWSWNTFNSPGVNLTASSGIQTMMNSLDSRLLLHGPESPDLSYPGGHFLPYPLAQVFPSSSTHLIVQIRP